MVNNTKTVDWRKVFSYLIFLYKRKYFRMYMTIEINDIIESIPNAESIVKREARVYVKGDVFSLRIYTEGDRKNRWRRLSGMKCIESLLPDWKIETFEELMKSKRDRVRVSPKAEGSTVGCFGTGMGNIRRAKRAGNRGVGQKINRIRNEWMNRIKCMRMGSGSGYVPLLHSRKTPFDSKSHLNIINI